MLLRTADNCTHFISVGVEVSAIYIDRCQTFSLWFFKSESAEVIARILIAPSSDAPGCLQINSKEQPRAGKHSFQPSTTSSELSTAELVTRAQIALPVRTTWIAPSWCQCTLFSPHPLTPPPPTTINSPPQIHTHGAHARLTKLGNTQINQSEEGGVGYLSLTVKSLVDPLFPGCSNPRKEHAPRHIQLGGIGKQRPGWDDDR